jgi:hypothetical protein
LQIRTVQAAALVIAKPLKPTNLAGVPARDGEYGKYWWVDEAFKTNRSQAAN